MQYAYFISPPNSYLNNPVLDTPPIDSTSVNYDDFDLPKVYLIQY